MKQDACDGKRARPKRSDYNYDSQGYCDNPGGPQAMSAHEVIADWLEDRRNCIGTEWNKDVEAASLAQALEVTGYAIVPKAALNWLDGSGADNEGKWFGECEEAAHNANRKHPRRYWWRSKFRKMCSVDGKSEP